MLNVKIVVEGGVVVDVVVTNECGDKVDFKYEVEDHDLCDVGDCDDCDKCNGTDTD